MKRSTLDRIREGTRLQQVLNVFARYLWDSLFPALGVLNTFRLSMQQWIWRLPDDLEAVSTPVKLRLLLEELGPTYVKMGQIVSSQASVLPADWGMELAKLQSDVPPFPQEKVRERIIEELGVPPEKVFAAFEPAPFAAAVHRGGAPGRPAGWAARGREDSAPGHPPADEVRSGPHAERGDRDGEPLGVSARGGPARHAGAVQHQRAGRAGLHG